MHFRTTAVSFLLLSAGALALPPGADGPSVPAHNIRTNVSQEIHSAPVKRGGEEWPDMLAPFNDDLCEGLPISDYDSENLVHFAFSGHCFRTDALHHKFHIVWGNPHPAAGICFFRDNKCKQITNGISNDDGLSKCLNMERNMEKRPTLDKRPWNSAKFWHGDPKKDKAPCDMVKMIG